MSNKPELVRGCRFDFLASLSFARSFEFFADLRFLGNFFRGFCLWHQY